jgi:NAD(P)-dependent dehydrogenase (short-subunit alcohol dehydrogenase family)
MSKVILVTGSNAGIGLELVRLLAKDNVVYMASRNEPSGKESQCVNISVVVILVSRSYCANNREKLKKEGLDVKLVQLDVTDPDSIRAARDVIDKAEGKLDVLVNNAGIPKRF